MSKKRVWVISLGILMVDVALFGVGLKCSKDFWKITFNGILSLNLTAVLSVFLVQVLAGQRRKYDFLVKLLDSIIKELSDDDLLNRDNHVRASILQKSIANKLLYINQACPTKFRADMEYINNTFEDLQTYYGDHNTTESNDPYYERAKTNISDKIVKLQLELYGLMTK